MVEEFDEKIVKQILKEFQKVLFDLKDNSDEGSSKYGYPPQSAIVKYHDKYDSNAMRIGKVIAALYISCDKISRLDNLEKEPELNPISGMYYFEGRFLFSISQDKSNAIIEWQVGPRFGRGYRYKIVNSDGEDYQLLDKEILWVS